MNGGNFGSKNHSIKNNIAIGALAGVAIMPGTSLRSDCTKISSFTIYKSVHYGIYYQDGSNIVVDSNIIIDSQINVFAKVVFPSILSHQTSNKYTLIRNSLIVGKSKDFSCTKDLIPNDFNSLYATTITAFGAGLNGRGKIGIAWADFNSATNGAPFKPWLKLLCFNLLYQN